MCLRQSSEAADGALPRQSVRSTGFQTADVEVGNGSPLAGGAIDSQPLLASDPADVVKPAESAAALKARKLSSAVIYGVINGIVGIPTMISFATIIYKASASRDH